MSLYQTPPQRPCVRIEWHVFCVFGNCWESYQEFLIWYWTIHEWKKKFSQHTICSHTGVIWNESDACSGFILFRWLCCHLTNRLMLMKLILKKFLTTLLNFAQSCFKEVTSSWKNSQAIENIFFNSKCNKNLNFFP